MSFQKVEHKIYIENESKYVLIPDYNPIHNADNWLVYVALESGQAYRNNSFELPKMKSNRLNNQNTIYKLAFLFNKLFDRRYCREMSILWPVI